MKIYSEITCKYYDNVNSCLKDEKLFKETEEKKKQEELNKQKQIKRKKKELADAIELAEQKIISANEAYREAKEKVKKILEESTKEANSIIDKAEAELIEAEKEKATAINNFTKEFGTYTATYTGKKAEEELKKTLASFDNHFLDMLIC